MLACSTRVPTPWGWTTVGALNVGDTVFDELGYPVFVSEATVPVPAPRPVYRVGFTNKIRERGAVLMTNDHEMVTWNRDAMRAFTRTTGAITVPTDWVAYNGRRLTLERVCDRMVVNDGAAGNKLMHVIPMAFPIIVPHGQGWTVPPYIMGLALQIHNRYTGIMTCTEDMWDWYEGVFRAEGYPLTRLGRARLKRWRPGDEVRFSSAMLNRDLGRLSEYNNRGLIPARYLRGDLKQRMDLLAGLLDIGRRTGRRMNETTRGSMTVWCGSSEQVCDQIIELLRTLGYTGVPAYEKDTNCYVAQFGPLENPHRAPKLRAGVTDPLLLKRRTFSRFCWRVQSAEPSDATDVRALKVTSPSGLMTVSDLFLPVGV